LDTPYRRGDGNRFYSSSGSDKYHGHHHYHPYRRSDRGYFPNEDKKAKPLSFGGVLKNLDDAKAWLLGMNNLFQLNDYMKNMKAKIVIFNLKGKAYICWEDVKGVRGTRTEELSWHEFKRLFKK